MGIADSGAIGCGADGLRFGRAWPRQKYYFGVDFLLLFTLVFERRYSLGVYFVFAVEPSAVGIVCFAPRKPLECKP
jgi:hypothetical protein